MRISDCSADVCSSDLDPRERQRGHSIDAAIAGLDHAPASGRSVHVNLIDTPGYPDFRGPTPSALAAVETVAIVVDADKGVEYGTRRMMTRVQQRGLCRAIGRASCRASGMRAVW